MRDKFSAYYVPTDEDLKSLWEKCDFILDANVLLNLYRYPGKARTDLINAFKAVKNRLWVPYHAALEYQQNRLNVIAEQKATFAQVRAILGDVVTKLHKELAAFQLEKRHSSIKPDEFIKGLSQSIDDYLATLSELEAQQQDVFQKNDPIRDQLHDLLTIGDAPKNQKEIDDLLKDAAERFANGVPPGYMDIDKDKQKDPVFTYSGITYERKYGDLVLWKQIIHYAKSKDKRFLVFITDDDKDDWWYRIDSQGLKTIGPRPELIDEIKRLGGVVHFHMYTSERFLNYARQELKLAISDESVSQVADVQASRRTSLRFPATLVENAVAVWLLSRYPNLEKSNSPGLDFVVKAPGNTIGVLVVGIADFPTTLGLLMKTKFAEQNLMHGLITRLHVVAANQGRLGTGAESISSVMNSYFERLGTNTIVTIGDVIAVPPGSTQLVFLPISTHGAGGKLIGG